MTDADSANTTSPANHRGLLAVVIILGVLLLLAFGGLVGGFILGVGPGGTAAADEPYLTSIPATVGERIIQSELDGNRVLLRLEGAGDKVIVLEASTGRVIGRIELDREP
jgi:hypothetical protein